jgi:hypothetical protein
MKQVERKILTKKEVKELMAKKAILLKNKEVILKPCLKQ